MRRKIWFENTEGNPIANWEISEFCDDPGLGDFIFIQGKRAQIINRRLLSFEELVMKKDGKTEGDRVFIIYIP